MHNGGSKHLWSRLIYGIVVEHAYTNVPTPSYAIFNRLLSSRSMKKPSNPSWWPPSGRAALVLSLRALTPLSLSPIQWSLPRHRRCQRCRPCRHRDRPPSLTMTQTIHPGTSLPAGGSEYCIIVTVSPNLQSNLHIETRYTWSHRYCKMLTNFPYPRPDTGSGYLGPGSKR